MVPARSEGDVVNRHLGFRGVALVLLPLILAGFVARQTYERGVKNTRRPDDDPPVPGKKNNPMMPVGWTKTYRVPGGHGKRGRVFTTTMGASTDLVAAGTRRMLVNAVYWCLEMENKIPRKGAKVDIVGKYNPRPFRSGGFKKNVKPADHAIKK